ncbi:MAG: YncE family protein [Thaumarchaeota archaeon]|nr:YncE family protein [Nitrososphaerota archaeon]
MSSMQSIRSITLICLLASLALLPSVAVANSASPTISSVSLGTVPRGVAVNSISGVIYTVLFLNGTTITLSSQTHDVVGRVATPSPYTVAVDSVTDQVYVSQGQGASISVIDSSGNTVLGTVQGAGTPYAMVVDEPQDLIFAADTSSNSLWIINGATNTVESRIPMGDTSALAFDPNDHEAFIGNVSSDSSSGSITVVSSDNQSIIRTFQIPIAPSHFAVDPVSHLLFVTGAGNAAGINFLAINDETFQTVYQHHLGDSPQIVTEAASPDVYVSDPGVNRLYELDGGTGKVLLNSSGDSARGISFAGVTAIAFDPGSGNLYITENEVTSLIILGSGATTSTPVLFAPLGYVVALLLIVALLLVALVVIRRRKGRKMPPDAVTQS